MPYRCTIVIPTYNRKESLKRTLDGLSRQSVSMSDFEAVVVSDGSTDSTHEFLESYSQTIPFSLRWFIQENQGPSVARNRGVEEARSEIVILLDDDVEPVAHFVAQHLKTQTEGEKIVVVGPMSPDPAYVKSEPVWIAWEHANLQKIYAMFLPGGEHFGKMMGPMHFYSGNASLKRQWLLDIGGFNPQYKRQEDVEFANRLQSQLNVDFLFDPRAEGLHHPIRSLESWLRIPTQYGTLDAERVKSGALSRATVDELMTDRHTLTRRLVAICSSNPKLIEPATILICTISKLLFASGRQSLAISALSGIYNVRYTVAFERSIGIAGHGK